jgi:streptogramin lyase
LNFVEYATTCSIPLGLLSHGPSTATMWFTAPQGCKRGQAGFVGSVEIATGAITTYALPKQSKPLAIVENAGYVWVADADKRSGNRLIYRFNADGTYKAFDLPSAIDVTDMVAGKDGNVWYVGSYQAKNATVAGIGSITPSGQAQLYPIAGNPTPKLVSVAAGSDGNLWAADGSGAIDKVDPSSGAVTTYPVGGSPLSITNAAKVLIYSDASAAQLSEITTAGKVTVYPAPKHQQPAFVASKTDGSVLYIDSADGGNGIGTFDPTKGTYSSEAEGPTKYLRALYNGPDGNMWFTDSSGDVGAYLKFVLTTTQTSLLITPPNCYGTFRVAESNHTGDFTVTSGNGAVASVAPASGSSGTTFTVYDVGPGSTTITVQDKMQNVVSIPVTVAGSCTSGSDTYGFTGTEQYFPVPAGVTALTVQAYGAPAFSATGGYVQATIPVTPGETLAIFVGGLGSGGGRGPGNGGTGGFNGGGAGGGGGSSHTGGGEGGGGASDVRQGGDDLTHRVIVAGGAGADGGGNGGGLIGGSAYGCGNDYAGGGCGGTQYAGGAGGGYPSYYESGEIGEIGAGGSGGQGGGFSDPSCLGGDGGGGGGGGYYGGGGGAGGSSCSGDARTRGPAKDKAVHNCCSGYSGGGGGGSSYIEPSAINVTNTQGGSTAAEVIVTWVPSKHPSSARHLQRNP